MLSSIFFLQARLRMIKVRNFRKYHKVGMSKGFDIPVVFSVILPTYYNKGDKNGID